jgi:hypothetical protein
MAIPIFLACVDHFMRLHYNNFITISLRPFLSNGLNTLSQDLLFLFPLPFLIKSYPIDSCVDTASCSLTTLPFSLTMQIKVVFMETSKYSIMGHGLLLFFWGFRPRVLLDIVKYSDFGVSLFLASLYASLVK